jgi:hypothetical protein
MRGRYGSLTTIVIFFANYLDHRVTDFNVRFFFVKLVSQSPLIGLKRLMNCTWS